MHVVFASGHKGPLICIIANKHMDEDDVFVQEVEGLYNTSGLTPGSIYMSKSRADNPVMWIH
jgi:hypothetical protein